MPIDESDILLSAALVAALPYALTALVGWGKQGPIASLQQIMHRLGAGMHRHG